MQARLPILVSDVKTMAEEVRKLGNGEVFIAEVVDDFVIAANKIKSIVDEMSKTDFVNDDDLGSDFDDPEHHVQDSSKYKNQYLAKLPCLP